VAELLALIAHWALAGLGALLGDMAQSAAVVALDTLRWATSWCTLAVTTWGAAGRAAASVLSWGLGAVTGQVVTAAVEALLTFRRSAGLARLTRLARLARLTTGRASTSISTGGVGAFARDVAHLTAVVALASILLGLLLRAVAAKVVARATNVA